MYDFGFYWDHISGFKEYVEKTLKDKQRMTLKECLIDLKRIKKIY